MAGHKNQSYDVSRRAFLRKMRWAPLVFLPAPFHVSQSRLLFAEASGQASFSLADSHLIPHYPAKSPLDDLFRHVTPGGDEFITEKYAFEIGRLLNEWSQNLMASPSALSVLEKYMDAAIAGTSLVPAQEITLRSGDAIEVLRRKFAAKPVVGREKFLEEIRNYLASMSRVVTAEFQIVGLETIVDSPLTVRADIRYDLAGTRSNKGREQHIGHWRTQWSRDDANTWQVTKWEATDETLSRAGAPIFIDITSQTLGQTDSYRNQLIHGVDYWRTALDGACGIDVYGNNGVAVGDIDNDGFDDIYVCQPSGLPNRLYHNRGDGTFEDVTEKTGVDVLDGTACALFADFENKGLQDLLVVCASGPLLFLNQGHGKFSLKQDAIKFARPPQGTFTHAAVADYDHDGHLDIYFCLYSYYQGLDQYRYPVPYFDARNGPANFLLHNEGNATFVDQTQAAGLNVDNDRYSFACAWGDSNSNGWPDLYVANDFGRSNLYRNNGDGTFKSISSEAGVEDAGAGMSACWADFDNSGNQDIYVANMWSAAGIRISQQPTFQEKDPGQVRALYRQHAQGNSLYRNQGNGQFINVSSQTGVEMGGWAWSSDAWDFDHDGYTDLYIANGYVSGPDTRDLASFFWRQVVGKSPEDATPSLKYEQGWNAINELVRTDASWAGYERNVLYANNRDGTFSEVSGTVGLDFTDDSRAFALADVDHDGRLEVILKNRNAPQIRILRNAMKDIGNSVCFRLHGNKSNRDAIGAAVTVETAGHPQTKYLQAGSGFLSQHSKELFFGIGKTQGLVHATIHWPSGLSQTFENVPANHRIEVVEGSADFVVKPFTAPPDSYSSAGDAPRAELLPSSVETWLIEPLSAPEFSLPNLSGNARDLRSFHGSALLLSFWSMASPASQEQIRLLQRSHSKFPSGTLTIVGINVDDAGDAERVRAFAAQEGISFPTLLSTQEVAGIYNIFYRYLFDRRRDLSIPTSFLVDKDGMIVKVYQGQVNPQQLITDAKSAPGTAADRIRRALPLNGTLYQGGFQRNAFTYGVALFQRGYLEPAATSFRQVIATKPDDPEAHYNLGTLELRRNNLQDARQYLEQAVKLRPNYPEAWNNLGMLAAQKGQTEQAINNFQQSLLQRPDYATALLNLGNLYRQRRRRDFVEAQKLLSHALEIQPDDPEANYSLGMFYAQQEKLTDALNYLERAVSLRPDYPDALNNLGVIFVREQRYPEAEDKFKNCIRVAQNFDQAYLNLARLYALLQDNEKAKATLQELLRLQPQHKVAQQTLEMLH